MASGEGVSGSQANTAAAPPQQKQFVKATREDIQLLLRLLTMEAKLPLQAAMVKVQGLREAGLAR